MNINWPEENKVYLIISLSKSRFSVSFKVNMKNYKNGPYFTVLKHCVWFISSLYPKKKKHFLHNLSSKCNQNAQPNSYLDFHSEMSQIWATNVLLLTKL